MRYLQQVWQWLTPSRPRFRIERNTEIRQWRVMERDPWGYYCMLGQHYESYAAAQQWADRCVTQERIAKGWRPIAEVAPNGEWKESR